MDEQIMTVAEVAGEATVEASKQNSLAGKLITGAVIFGAGVVTGIVAPHIKSWFKGIKAAKKAAKEAKVANDETSNG